MLYSNLFIILLNVVLISATINNSKKTQQNDTENEFRDERIIGGEFANEGEVPWQVALLNSDGKYFCGGSLLKTDVFENRVIVTAASCFTGYDFDLKFILNFVRIYFLNFSKITSYPGIF